MSSLFFPLPVCSRLTFSLKLKSTLLKVRHWRLSLQALLLASLSAAIDAVAGCLIMLSVWTAVKSDVQGPKLQFHFQKSEFCTTKPISVLLIVYFVFCFFFFSIIFFLVLSEVHLSLMKIWFFCLNTDISSLKWKTFKASWQHRPNNLGLLNFWSFDIPILMCCPLVPAASGGTPWASIFTWARQYIRASVPVSADFSGYTSLCLSV